MTDIRHIKIRTIEETLEEDYVYGKTKAPISTGIEEFDQKNVTLGRGEPNTIMARSGVGKTTKALNIAVKNSIKHNQKFLIISQEMANIPVIRRMIAMISGTEERTWREYTAQDENEFDFKKEKAKEAVSVLNGNIHITDHSFTLTELLAVIDKYIKLDFDGIFCDYFQLIHYDGDIKANSEADRLKFVSEAVKHRVKNSNLMFCWLSQVLESEKKAEDDKIKQTRQVFTDSATVLNIFKDQQLEGKLIMQVQKSRHDGNTGLIIEVPFDGAKQRIGEYDNITKLKDVKIDYLRDKQYKILHKENIKIGKELMKSIGFEE